MMKVCIVGAGAIGGFIGTRLAVAGRCKLSVMARGRTLAAIRKNGLRLHQDNEVMQAHVQASDKASNLGRQDLVIVAVKSPVLPLVARDVATMLDPETIVLPAMNGVPWWFHRGTALGNGPLESVDPGGTIAATIPFESVLGCVVHASCTATEPGVVHQMMGKALIVGEPEGGESLRADTVADLLAHAGFDVSVSSNIRHDIWYKLWGNMTMNPVSAITGATIDRLLADPLVRAFCSEAMREAAAIGERLCCSITQSAEDRHSVTAKLGAFKTSMLQDAEANRPIELDALVTAVHEIGRRLGEPTPNIDALLGLTRLFGRVHRIYPEASP